MNELLDAMDLPAGRLDGPPPTTRCPDRVHAEQRRRVFGVNGGPAYNGCTAAAAQ
jgi:hypothetical protein